MKKILLGCSFAAFLFSCNNDGEKAATPAAETPVVAAADKPAVALPYTASYSSTWSTDVSDADLKTVMMSYKDWETDRKSTRLNSSHHRLSRMPSSA